MNRKGFTLIELLAVIVVLTIIAVITVPVILDVIDKSKRELAINSAYKYRDEINKSYASKIIDNNSYDLKDGEYDISYYIDQGVQVSGESPSGGWVLIEDDEVSDFSFKIGEYAVTYYSSTDTIEAIKDGEVVLSPSQSKALVYIDSLKQVKGNVSDIFNLPVQGVSNGDVSSGWVALKNGEAIGYSLLVGDKTVELSTKNDSINDIVTFLATSYLNGLTTPSEDQVVDITESGKLKGGFIEYVSENSIISINDYSLKYEIDGVTKYANYDKTSNELVMEETRHFKPIPGMEVSGVKYYDASWIKSNPVQYHPGYVGTGNNDEIQPHKDCDGETGCRIWYPYSEFTEIRDGVTYTYVNMIMDRNTTANVSGWISSTHWTTPPSNTGVTYPEGTTFTNDSYDTYGNNKKGPLTVLNQLHADTDEWNLNLRTDSYTPVSNSYSNYTIDYSGYKARLISAEEIALITRKNTASNPNTWGLNDSYFYFGSLNNNAYNKQSADQQAVQRSYSWLFDYTSQCTTYGCSIADSSTQGYWASSPITDDSDFAWRVFYTGYLNRSHVNYDGFGVRPVITVLKSDIF